VLAAQHAVQELPGALPQTAADVLHDLAALLPDVLRRPAGLLRQVDRLALDQGEILLSEAVVEELNRVLTRPKLGAYVSSSEREKFLMSFLHEARLVEVDKVLKVCRDPKDDKFLGPSGGGDSRLLPKSRSGPGSRRRPPAS
jgi:putative PIN family toxin of toxin-antitoxin system